MEDRAGGLNLKTQDLILGTQPQERREKPHADQPQKCPRCDSLHTKFCYYNNYSLSQPRYFCKTCRRYWTKGGTLRNVPVGGGYRKGSKRSKRTISDNNPSIQQDGEAAAFPFSPFNAIRPQFLLNQSSKGPTSITDVKVSAGIPSISSLVTHPQFNNGLTLGHYDTIFGSSMLPQPPQQATTLPSSEGLVSQIERWKAGDPSHGPITMAIPTSGAGNEAAASTVPSLIKSEPQTAFEGSTNASSIGVCYWDGSGGGQWTDFSGYGPSTSFS